ncbi:MAG: helix-turn-helix domain-containing protein [Candidatus Omnitrophota bacterium]|nr:helix-turn-helix domain-containing protein [Candidatus Omnitrophota bacterium]
MDIENSFITIQKGEIYKAVIGDIEKSLIEKALEYTSGNQITAARLLGINRNTIRAKIKRLNINVERFKL